MHLVTDGSMERKSFADAFVAQEDRVTPLAKVGGQIVVSGRMDDSYKQLIVV